MSPTTSPKAEHSVYHAEFIASGRYLRGWSERTVRTYQQGLATLADTPLTKAGLAAWVITQRERGLTRGGVNMYARTINSYLTWLHEEGHVRERLRIKLLPNPPHAITTFSDQEVRRIVSHRPQGRMRVRTSTLIMLLLDTGLRISEALGLERRKRYRQLVGNVSGAIQPLRRWY
jgi:integrase